MWRIVPAEERQAFVRIVADLMRNAPAFKTAMLRATHEWPYSCEHNLTCTSMNRIAWLGHAGCCIAHEAPEDLTRLAWHTLNTNEQDAANAAAAEVLADWENRYKEHCAQKADRH